MAQYTFDLLMILLSGSAELERENEKTETSSANFSDHFTPKELHVLDNQPTDIQENQNNYRSP